MSTLPAPAGGPPGGFAAWLHTADGLRLRAVYWPHPAPLGRVLLLSGRTEYAEKFTRLAGELHAAGLASATVDWRGQGLSDRLLSDPRKGHITDFADYQLDLAALLQGFEGESPLFVVSHSMGGAIALRALINGLPARAAAFCAPMWGIQTLTPQNRFSLWMLHRAARSPAASYYAPAPGTGPICEIESLPFGPNPLTSDPLEWAAQQAHLKAQPELVIAGPTIAWANAAFRECAALAALPSPDLPALVALGTEERIVCPQAIAHRIAAWPKAERLQIEGAAHEILQERPAHRHAFAQSLISMFHRSLA